MPLDFPYVTGKTQRARGRVAGAGLADRANLAAWWRFKGNYTIVNGAVSVWPDMSGNGRSMLQATAAARPTLDSDWSLKFDGIAQFMQATFTLPQPATIYAAIRQITWTSGDIILDGSAGTTKLTQTGSTPAIAMNGGSALSGDSSIPVGGKGVLACVFNGTSSVYQASGGSALSSITGDAGAGTPGGVTIGAARTSANFANINVYEVLAYSVAHDATTRQRILRYLGRIAQVGGV